MYNLASGPGNEGPGDPNMKAKVKMSVSADDLTAYQVATLKRCGHTTVLDAIGKWSRGEAGGLPATRFGRQWRVARADARAWRPGRKGWPKGLKRRGLRGRADRPARRPRQGAAIHGAARAAR